MKNKVTIYTIAEELGMKVFLLTDRLVNRKNADISRFDRGSFDELKNFLESIR